jgi:hypothetical protein
MTQNGSDPRKRGRKGEAALNDRYGPQSLSPVCLYGPLVELYDRRVGNNTWGVIQNTFWGGGGVNGCVRAHVTCESRN